MKRFIEGVGRTQVTLLPECLDDYIAEDNPIRVVDAYVEELDLEELGFAGAEPVGTEDISRAVTAASLLRERRLVIARLRRLGVHVVEAP